VSILWYLFSFLSSATIVLAAIRIHVWLGGAAPQFNDPAQWYLIIPVFLYVLFLSVLGEEIGWRGYALPKLQESRNALVASLIIGVVWGFWHLPLFWIEGSFHQEIPLILFVLQDVALSIVLTWLYNGTGGSLLIVHLFHAASSTTLGLLPILPMDTGGEIGPLWIAVGLLWIIALVIIAMNGPATLSRNRASS
jgi:membrane protease YdiL (CAAX protease family)